MSRAPDTTSRPILGVQRLGLVLGLFAVLFAALSEVGHVEVPATALAAVPILGGATLACAAISILFGARTLPGVKLFLLGAAAFAIAPFFWGAVVLIALWVIGNFFDLFDVLDLFE